MSSHRGLAHWIAAHWQGTVRCQTVNDETGVIGLPHPYIVPCARAVFRELYYWDTAFAAWGLIAQGKRELARDCARDMLELVRRYGFVPNAAHRNLLNRSQPPLLGFLCEQVAEAFPEERRSWIAEALPQLEREYGFWMSQRLLPCGLNHYGHHASDAELLALYDDCGPRRLHTALCNAENSSECLAAGRELMAEAESGWDFTPRFERRANDFAPVDLNAILFANEMRLGAWHRELGDTAAAKRFTDLAAQRRAKMDALLFDEKPGIWLDFDSVHARRGTVISAASYFPLWCGAASPEQAVRAAGVLQEKLWTPYGVMVCAMPPNQTFSYQWDAPKLWPPLQFAAMAGLLRYGMPEAAREIARRFADTVLKQFDATGDLWEKYDGLNGAVQRQNTEYATPAMMGWTAGSYLFAVTVLEQYAVSGAW